MGIFIFFIALFFIALIIIIRIWNFFISLFRFGKNRKTESSETLSSKKSDRKRRKVFSKSEGEYVDYEEIK